MTPWRFPQPPSRPGHSPHDGTNFLVLVTIEHFAVTGGSRTPGADPHNGPLPLFSLCLTDFEERFLSALHHKRLQYFSHTLEVGVRITALIFSILDLPESAGSAFRTVWHIPQLYFTSTQCLFQPS